MSFPIATGNCTPPYHLAGSFGKPKIESSQPKVYALTAMNCRAFETSRYARIYFCCYSQIFRDPHFNETQDKVVLSGLEGLEKCRHCSKQHRGGILLKPYLPCLSLL